MDPSTNRRLREGMTRSRLQLRLTLVCSFLVTMTAATAQQNSPSPDRAVDRLSISRPTWHRGAGLVYGAITVRNHNPYSVINLILSCDLFDEWGNPLGSKGTA